MKLKGTPREIIVRGRMSRKGFVGERESWRGGEGPGTGEETASFQKMEYKIGKQVKSLGNRLKGNRDE